MQPVARTALLKSSKVLLIRRLLPAFFLRFFFLPGIFTLDASAVLMQNEYR